MGVGRFTGAPRRGETAQQYVIRASFPGTTKLIRRHRVRAVVAKIAELKAEGAVVIEIYDRFSVPLADSEMIHDPDERAALFAALEAEEP